MLIPAIVCAVLMFGCIKYGRIKLPSEDHKGIGIEQLGANWKNYHVYYAGWPGDYPMAVVFDPKEDGRTLLCESWIRITDPGRLTRVIRLIQTRFNPRIYEIVGPEDHFFGYLFSGRNHLYTRAVNERTLRVFDVEMPPSGP